MEKTLLILGHQDFAASRYNKALLESASGAKNLTIRIIDWEFDPKEEQEVLLSHQNIILQFPLIWYSVPAKLKNYLDKVLTYGFAFGEQYALKGKRGFIATTTGGLQEYYQPNGLNKYTIEELLRPLERTFEYCKMTYESKPFVVHGTIAGRISEEAFAQKLSEYKAYIYSICQ